MVIPSPSTTVLTWRCFKPNMLLPLFNPSLKSLLRLKVGVMSSSALATSFLCLHLSTRIRIPVCSHGSRDLHGCHWIIRACHKEACCTLCASINIMLFPCQRHFPHFWRVESPAYGQFNLREEMPSQERPTIDRASMDLGRENAQGMCHPVKRDPTLIPDLTSGVGNQVTNF